MALTEKTLFFEISSLKTLVPSGDVISTLIDPEIILKVMLKSVRE